MDISSHSNKRIVETVRASDLKPKPISWYWHGWLAAGRMHILGGDPGTGIPKIFEKSCNVQKMGSFYAA